MTGRPTKYREEFAEQAYKLCLLGATDKDMADFFEVDERTVNNWKADHEEFFQSIKSGKTEADATIAASLYETAKGYSYTEEQAIKVKIGQYEERVETVTVGKYKPAETTAGIFWLKNRQKTKWRDKLEVDADVKLTPVLNVSVSHPEPDASSEAD